MSFGRFSAEAGACAPDAGGSCPDYASLLQTLPLKGALHGDDPMSEAIVLMKAEESSEELLLPGHSLYKVGAGSGFDNKHTHDSGALANTSRAEVMRQRKVFVDRMFETAAEIIRTTVTPDIVSFTIEVLQTINGMVLPAIDREHAEDLGMLADLWEPMRSASSLADLHSSSIEDLQEAHTRASAEHSQCRAAEAEICTQAEKARCDGFQSDLESKSCAYAVQVQLAQSQVPAAFQQASVTYESAIQNVQTEEDVRKTEYETLQKTLCLLNRIDTDNPVEGEPCAGEFGNADEVVQSCQQLDVDTTFLDISYNSTRQAPELPEVPPHPCSQEYLQAEYANLAPSGSCGVPAVCHPCSGFGEAPVIPLWRQHGEDRTKCRDGDVQIVSTQHECQQVAIAAGHDYYSFGHSERSSGGHKCFSSATCENPRITAGNEWNVYTQLWHRHGEDRTKCRDGSDVQIVSTQLECQHVASAAGHDYYSFRHNEMNNGGHKCFSAATCQNPPQRRTTHGACT